MKILRKDRTHHTKTLESPGEIAGKARRRAEQPEEDQRSTQKNRMTIINKTNLRKNIRKSY